MIEAPTIEMAIGRNTRALEKDSVRVRSTRTAYSSPIAVAAIGTSRVQTKVLNRTRWYSDSEKRVT